MRGVLGLLFALAAVASAQEPIRVRVGKPNWSAGGSTITAPVMITNAADSALQVATRIELPPEWRLLTGSGPMLVEAGGTGLAMVGVSVPSRATAGPYRVPVSVLVNGQVGGSDTIAVVVAWRRAIALDLLERPNFVVSGRSYDARFLLRNRGNAPASVRLNARSSLGTPSLTDTEVMLAPDESRVVQVRVETRAGLDAATDDILEIAAVERDSASQAMAASARVTVVPEPNRSIEEYLRVPARVNLRAANSDAVSRFEAFGQGLVRDGGRISMDFLVRGPTGKFAAFGERDEYRVALRAPAWRARAGDHTYMLSSLTSVGQPGFGGGLDVTRGAFGVGGYGQQFRRAPEKGSESGAYVSLTPREGARVSVNAVSRAGGPLAGRIASAAASLERASFDADMEIARSSGAGASGLARSARVSGAFGYVTYDVGHLAADTGFAGSQRGAQHNYVIARARPWDFVSFGVNGSLHRVDLSRSVHVPYEDRLDGGALSATFFDRVMVEAGRTMRGTLIQGQSAMGGQNAVRARADHDARLATVSLEVEAGRARDALAADRDFTDVTLGARRGFARGQGGVYAQRYSGGSLIKGADGTTTLGGDASLSLGGATQATLLAYATRLHTAQKEWHAQLDALITRSLRNGATITLRARLLTGGSLPPADRSVAYLEYGLPLRLPVSRLRTPGRVYGRVVDAVTGQGVRGALVRLGPQVAITDRNGDVAFGGVPAGEHRLSMSQETSFANAVFVEDPTVYIDGTRTSPTTFRVAVARSARVDIDVRRFIAARTGVAGVPDSLAEAGAVANATLVLAGERDTLFRTTGDNGRASFTDIPPGHWTVAVRGDAPAFHRFDPDRLELDLQPGETRAATFRLVPRRREVQIIGGGQDLRAAPAAPRNPPVPAAAKTVKPNEQRRER